MCAFFLPDESLDAAEAAGGVASFIFDAIESSWVTSTGFRVLLGMEPGAVLGDRANVAQRVHPADRVAMLGAPDGTSAAAPRYIVAYRVLLGDGSVRRIRERAAVQRGPTLGHGTHFIPETWVTVWPRTG